MSNSNHSTSTCHPPVQHHYLNLISTIIFNQPLLTTYFLTTTTSNLLLQTKTCLLYQQQIIENTLLCIQQRPVPVCRFKRRYLLKDCFLQESFNRSTTRPIFHTDIKTHVQLTKASTRLQKAHLLGGNRSYVTHHNRKTGCSSRVYWAISRQHKYSW